MKMQILLVFTLAVSALCTVNAMNRCGQSCRFRFCKADGMDTIIPKPGRRLLLRDADITSQPFVCERLSTGRIKVEETGVSMVYSASRLGTKPEPFVNVDKFSNNPKFPKNYFGLGSVDFPSIPGEKGVFRTRAGGLFEAASDDLCVKIPITSYRVVESNTVVSTRDPDDCISFRTIVPTILIELTWDTSDDLDVNVVEPNGNKISFDDEFSSTGGRLIRDQLVGRCGEDPNGREQIRWLLDGGNPLKGTYTVQVRHWNNCGTGPTNWSLAIILDGVVDQFETGTSNLDDDTLIQEFTFVY